ncbi:large conductance mechanosensitive channel protein MscL [Oerskovia flava]|uniref:large conductance mechanosensitive channel protein MscL n=1 Tax=Oerskovia flava TaxID=2986422 RepID=UPI0022400E46|nr:large conductance mechanosensitive channel protein MscL [Oerskovia sp. JB1-3-2]
MKNVLGGFKEFVLRGNVVDLAVGIVIGAAFSAVVAALVDGLFTPLIAAIFGATDLTKVGVFTINEAVFSVGLFLDALLKFLIVAAAIYFVIVMPMNALASRRKSGEEEEPAAPAEDVLVLQEIRDLLAAQNAARGGPAAPPAPPAGPADRPTL